jgi:hypothetical protein
MLPVDAPIGSIEHNERGVIPTAYQSSLEIYNNWCRYAYDWDAIFAVLDELHKAEQVAAQGVYYGTYWPVLGLDIPESAGWGTGSEIESFSDSDTNAGVASDPIENTPS